MIMGPRDSWFTAESVGRLLSQPWTVTPRSDRVGLRLQGEQALERQLQGELASEATVPGSIEVPNDGQPVLFLRDQPVTGGYPVIAVLTPEALALAAQLPTGARVAFRAIGQQPSGMINDEKRNR